MFRRGKVFRWRNSKRIKEGLKEMSRQVRLKRVDTPLPDPHAKTLHIVCTNRVTLENGGVNAILLQALCQG